MDENKLAVLKSLPYRVLPTCGLCMHRNIDRRSDFGTCEVHMYEHGRHSGPMRHLSIHRSGNCPSFEVDDDWASLEGFRELVEI